MPLSGLNALPVGVALAVRAEEFLAALDKRAWAIRQKGERRAHLLVLVSDRGEAAWQGTRAALEAPALLWLPGNIEGSIEVSGGAQGFLLSMNDDFLIKTVANSPEALDLRRTTDRVALIGDDALAPHLDAIAGSCRAIVSELHAPGHGGTTLIASHLLLLCLQLWRLGSSHDERLEAAARGGGWAARMMNGSRRLRAAAARRW